MFCPQCATENGIELGYCRQCGQSLADVRLALRGTPTEALKKLVAGQKLLNGGITTLVTFTFVALIITTIGVIMGHPVLSTIGMINALLGALIGLPIMFVGKASVKRATRLLSGSHLEFDRVALNTQRRDELPATGADSQLSGPPNSVTENTTLNLKTASRAPRELER